MRPSRMCSRFRALSRRNRDAPGDHLDLVAQVTVERRAQVERTWHAADERDHVDSEAGLQLGELEQLVEHDVGVGVALEEDAQIGLAAR